MPHLPTHILACMDTEGAAATAMAQARHLAGVFGAELHLAQVVQQSLAGGYLLEPLSEDESLRRGKAVFEMYGVETVGAHLQVKQGNPAKEIVELTFEVGADLLVLGRHANRGMVAGRTANRIVGLSDVPVLVHKRWDVLSYRRILVACDLSGYSTQALLTAVAWAERLGGEVSVVHVFEPPDYAFGHGHESAVTLRDRERSKLEESLRRVGQGGLIPTLHHITGEPVDAIQKVADATQADLVVMGTHGRTGLSRLLLGSVAERVLAIERMSVLVVRGEAQK